MVGDTWWALFISLERSGKTANLAEADRQLTIEVRSTNAAGTSETVERIIEWKLTEIGKIRGDERYRMVGDTLEKYTVTVKDHLDKVPVTFRTPKQCLRR